MPLIKSFCIIILLLLIGEDLIKAQIVVRGKILNEGNAPLSFMQATFKIANKDIFKTISDSIGNYKAEVKSPGRYEIVLTSKMYQVQNPQIQIQADTTFNIIAHSTIQLLSTVKVKASKPIIEHKIDRLVFNVESLTTSIGGDALDILKRTPTVKLQNDQLGIVGKGSVNLMINERLIKLSGEDLVNYVKSIPSDNISKIEVIMVPPSKYDAEGNSGLINIVLKQPKQSYYSGNLNSSFTKSKYTSGNYSGGLTYQRDKFTALVSVNYENGSSGPSQDYTILYPNLTWDESKNSRSFKKNFSGSTSINYQLTKNTNIGIDYSGMNSTPRTQSKNTSLIYNGITHNLDSSIVTPANIGYNRRSDSFNLYAVNKLDTNGKTIYIDANYFRYNTDIDNRFSSNTYSLDGTAISGRNIVANNLSGQNIKIYSSKIDVDLPLKVVTISFGAKISAINNTSDIQYFNLLESSQIPDPGRSNAFKYTENTQATYFSLNKKLKNNIEVKAGLRLENTQTIGSSLRSEQKNNYTKLFPTIFVGYPISDGIYLSTSYSQRIERPSYINLNPFRFYSTANNYTEGNPLLKPFFSHNFDITLSSGNFYHSLYYSLQHNGIDQVTFVDVSTRSQVTSPKNFYTSKTVGFSEYYVYTKVKGWQSNNGLNIFYGQTTSNLEGTLPKISGLTTYFNTNNIFNINNSQTIKAELDVIYQTPYIANSYKASSFYTVSAGTRVMLLKKQLQLGFLINDIFKSSGITFTNVVNNVNQSKFSYYDTQFIKLSLKYNFGKSINFKKYTGSNEEEKNRLHAP